LFVWLLALLVGIHQIIYYYYYYYCYYYYCCFILIESIGCTERNYISSSVDSMEFSTVRTHKFFSVPIFRKRKRFSRSNILKGRANQQKKAKFIDCDITYKRSLKGIMWSSVVCVVNE
jgi:hypothetical protein